MGLRARLLLLVLLPTIPGLLLALYTNLEQRRFATAKVGKDALKLVQVVAAGQNGLIETTRGHLIGLSKYPQAYGSDFSSFEKFFDTMCKVYPDYTDFGIIETNGALISCSVGRKGQTNLAGHLYFQRVLKTRELAVGEYQPPDGQCKVGLPIGYPLRDDKGRLVRVVYATLDLAALSQALAKSQLPEGGVAEVFDSTGHLLARYPDHQEWAGKALVNSPLFMTIARKGEGIAEIEGLRGAAKLHAFTAIRSGANPNFYVSVGIPSSLAYSETKHMLLFNLAVLGAVALLAVMASWTYADRYILRPINALVATTRRVASGDLSARSGVAHASVELVQLVRAFDEMATSLQRQRSEMERAQKEIALLNETLEGRVSERTAQLAELNRQLEAFSYSVSHDLRAPLRHMSGFLAILENDSGSTFTEEGRRFLKQISDAIVRMNTLVEDLLSFSRTSREELRREMVAMTDLVLEVRRELSSGTDARNIRWDIQPLPQAFVDRNMFKQVWTNLLSNAVKYTRPRPQAEISIGCRDHQAETEFYVRDNGAGFDMKYADKLFGAFQRLHSPKEFEGTGIGLANVQRIVARHGGKTWAQGEIDRGATFWFSLPKVAVE